MTGFNDNWIDEFVDESDISEDEEIDENGTEFRERIRESLF